MFRSLKLRASDLYATLGMSGAAIFLMSGYEVVRSSSNSLFQASYGPQGFSAVLTVVPIFALVGLAFYDRMLLRCGARRALGVSSLASAFLLFALWWGIRAELKVCRFLLVVFREVYIMLIVEQYWSFMNSTIQRKSAALLLGVFGAFGSVGAMLGGFITTHVAQNYGTIYLPLIAAAGLIPAALVANLTYRICGEPRPVTSGSGESVRSAFMGVSLFKSSPALVFILVLVVCTQGIATASNLLFQNQLQTSFPDLDAQTAFSGKFYVWLNAATLVGQLALAPLALKFLSPLFVQLALPTIHLCTHAFAIFSPSLWSVGGAFLIFKSLDYSMFRASKEILYMPLDFDARFRAKELIDVFGYRFSKGATSLVFFLMERLLPFSLVYYPVSVCFLSLVWIGSGAKLARKISAH